MRQVTVHEAKTHLSRLLDAVEGGEEIVVARGRDPIAKLVPFNTLKAKRIPGKDRGKFKVRADFNRLPKSITDAFYR